MLNPFKICKEFINLKNSWYFAIIKLPPRKLTVQYLKLKRNFSTKWNFFFFLGSLIWIHFVYKTYTRWVVVDGRRNREEEIYHHKAISRMSRKLSHCVHEKFLMSRYSMHENNVIRLWSCLAIFQLLRFSSWLIITGTAYTRRDEVEIYVFITSSPLSSSSLAANLLQPLTFSVFIYILFFLFFVLLSLLLPVSLFHSHTPLSISLLVCLEINDIIRQG